MSTLGRHQALSRLKRADVSGPSLHVHQSLVAADEEAMSLPHYKGRPCCSSPKAPLLTASEELPWSRFSFALAGPGSPPALILLRLLASSCYDCSLLLGVGLALLSSLFNSRFRTRSSSLWSSINQSITMSTSDNGTCQCCPRCPCRVASKWVKIFLSLSSYRPHIFFCTHPPSFPSRACGLFVYAVHIQLITTVVEMILSILFVDSSMGSNAMSIMPCIQRGFYFFTHVNCWLCLSVCRGNNRNMGLGTKAGATDIKRYLPVSPSQKPLVPPIYFVTSTKSDHACFPLAPLTQG